MRRRFSLKCCVSIVVCVLFVYIFLTLNHFDLENSKAVDRKAPKHQPGDDHLSSVCYALKDEHNSKVELHYDVTTLNLLGFIETPEDQIIRDEGTHIQCFNIQCTCILQYMYIVYDVYIVNQ